MPGLCEVADGVNGVIYAARGDTLNATHSLGAMIPFADWASAGVKLTGKAQDLNQVSKVVSTEKMESIYSPIYKDVVNSPLGKTQNQLDLLTNTHYQLGTPNAFTFNTPFAKTDIPTSIKNGATDVKVEVKNVDIVTKGTGKETYQYLKDYKNNKYFTRSVEYNAGKDGTGFTYKVYQRGDINWDMVRTQGAKKGRGLTNAEASAKYGLAPILDDASSVATLHHSQQKGIGPLYEASTRYHNISNAKRAPLHPYKGKLNPFYPMDETTRGAFQKVDSINYLKIRGEETLGGK